MQTLFVAVDGGPREALAPVAEHFGVTLADVSCDAAGSDAHWAARLGPARVLIVGTSDSARGRLVETAARRAARRAGLPIAAIEDFPGNYWHADGGEADLVLAESAAAGDICLRKLGAQAPAVAIVPPARYDGYRRRLTDLRRETASRWTADPPGRYRVLWAGQPETDDCMRTLRALIPALKALDAEFLFKAHPRDSGYTSGEYGRVLDQAGLRWSDLTAASVEAALSAAPHLVLTQFSSVAIEGGFFGIPSLWVLLPDAGGTRLCSKKGYAEPPLCITSGAVCVTDARDCERALRLALTNEAQASLIRCFDTYFAVDRPAMPLTLQAITALIDVSQD